MPQIKLTYFNIQGPAEPTRLALTIGGVPFEDVRVDREQMLAMRAAGELNPDGCCGGQLPQLVVDGKVLHQSMAMATYCAKLTGLYPDDPWLAAKCDEATQFIIQDVRGRLIEPSMRGSDEEKAAARAKLTAESLPEKFGMMEKLLAANPSGWLVGDKLTIADLHLYVLCNWIGMGVLDGIPKSVITDQPCITALVKKINELPAVDTWNKEKNGGKLPWF